ncbi:isoprenylcysteine carboxylmethyltransferase family protein [Promethearchaeum syntrophicum]|uniref:Isoprenylcysteine carboxylmethyltransferase family protein n=1 Tax=Promethearchaeum syntrophicum TaxID=2594042 RepID=A0A5B9DBI3_9ARCH|nr:isoprenylcysteine carboxylmethyltransferase family protein [Candidatus Prometheoarchaeum syntrophicum]QEE16100.1 hypothetical protein DSAG12_01929 [Candidatus Prometheoarchaeum syntrophicum]
MNNNSKVNTKWLETINVIIMSVAFIALILTGFFIHNEEIIMFIHYIGWILWVLSVILAFSPNFIFKKYGGVQKGESYMKTTKLVNKGIYSIIRHPQYGGGIYIAFSLILIQQTLVSVILGIISIITSYLSMIFEDKRLIVKFGEDYVEYMKKVPRVNVISGCIRKINRK